MLVLLRSVIGHDQDVGVIALVVVIEGIKEDTQAVPVIIVAKYGTFVPFDVCVP